jgi:hypothetical protein
LKKPTPLEKISFVLFDAEALAEFEKALAEIPSGSDAQAAPKAGRK